VGPQTLTFDHRIDIISSNILAAVGMDQDVLLPGVTTTKDIYASLMDLQSCTNAVTTLSIVDFFRFLRRRSSSRRCRTPSMATCSARQRLHRPLPEGEAPEQPSPGLRPASPKGRGTRATLTRPAAGLSQRERHDGP
jgi:hypothetical protein